MAYISTENVKKIRDGLKKRLPEIKFSVRREHYSTLLISVMKSTIDLPAANEYADPDATYRQISEYHLNSYSQEIQDLFKTVNEVIAESYELASARDSDPQSDYFNHNYYYYFSFGQYDKPYIKIDNKKEGK